MQIKLSARLSLIAEQVDSGAKVADIGSDHALLPVFLIQAGIAKVAIAGEINSGPFQAACNQVQMANLAEVIQVRQGDGLEVIEPEEVDTITIAGMGGQLIVSILNKDHSKLSTIKRLILQPNVGENYVRHWLVDHNWQLVKEIIMEEDHQIYVILVAEQSTHAVEFNQNLYAADRYSMQDKFKFGPYLLNHYHPAFEKKWRAEVIKLIMICDEVSRSSSTAAKEKLFHIEKEIRQIEEVLVCFAKDKPL